MPMSLDSRGSFSRLERLLLDSLTRWSKTNSLLRILRLAVIVATENNLGTSFLFPLFLGRLATLLIVLLTSDPSFWKTKWNLYHEFFATNSFNFEMLPFLEFIFSFIVYVNNKFKSFLANYVSSLLMNNLPEYVKILYLCFVETIFNISAKKISIISVPNKAKINKN